METKLTNTRSIRKAASHEDDVLRVHEGRVVVVPGQQWLGAGSTDTKIATRDEQKLSYSCRVNPEHPEWRARPYNILLGKGCAACSAQRNSASAGKTRSPRATEAEKQQARDMCALGMTRQQIADALGRSLYAINTWCNPESAERQRLKIAQWKEENRERHRANSRRYQSEFTHGRVKKAIRNASSRGIYREYDEATGELLGQMWESYHCTGLDPEEERKMLQLERRMRDLNKRKKDGKKWTLEHLLPLSMGGEHRVYNLAIRPWCHNSSKGASLNPRDMEVRRKNIAALFELHD